MKPHDYVSGLKPGKSVFNLSHQKKFTCDMGLLIPTMLLEAIPGDVFTIGNKVLARFMPMATPIMHDVMIYFHYFFVPYRILWPETISGTPPEPTDGWELFITRGEDGDQAPTIPTWPYQGDVSQDSLWCHFGFPYDIWVNQENLPTAFPLYAYNMIYNDWYRIEQVQDRRTDVDVTIAKRNWQRDPFTTCLATQQRGTAPSIAISGYASFDEDNFDGVGSTTYSNSGRIVVDGDPNNSVIEIETNSGTPSTQSLEANFKAMLDDNSLDSSASFTVSDMRLAFQIQKWQERNARVGSRYVEFINGHFGTAPRDSRMQNPEYIGGTKTPMIISEVVQTSESGSTPQGQLTGHGLAVDAQFAGKYRVEEFGLIMGLMSVMPKSGYSQGLPRAWNRKTAFDYPFPEFANLSERGVEKMELYAFTNQSSNENVFGYKPMYDELREQYDYVAGEFCNGCSMDDWHMSRQLSGYPSLNDTFLQCVPRKDFLVAPTEDALIVSVGNIVKAVRPIPITSTPGLIDHS